MLMSNENLDFDHYLFRVQGCNCIHDYFYLSNRLEYIKRIRTNKSRNSLRLRC